MKLRYPVTSGNTKVTQWYGQSDISYAQYGYKGHNGIDFGGTPGEPILAAADGTVEKIGYEAGGYGNYVRLRHGDGSETLYGHMNSIGVKAGQKVYAGDILGGMGYTGNVIPAGIGGTHLHFGYRPQGYNAKNGYGGYEDPKGYFTEENTIEGVGLKAGKAVVIADIVNMRENGDGRVIAMLVGGTEIEITGEGIEKGGLKRYPVRLAGWIADRDVTGIPLIENIC